MFYVHSVRIMLGEMSAPASGAHVVVAAKGWLHGPLLGLPAERQGCGEANGVLVVVVFFSRTVCARS